MTTMKQAPYGSWKSPITSALIVSETVDLQEAFCDGADTYWIESRPNEGGRSALVRQDQNGENADVTPDPFNVRTRVHEYGGGAYTVADGVAYCSNFSDNLVYRHEAGKAPAAITSDSALRYADLEFDRRRNRVIGVQEDHRGAGEAVNSLVGLAADGLREPSILASGNDFYSSPCLSPSGEQLAWLTWNHPNMPWDGTELWIADVAADGTLANQRLVAGGPQESIFQPQWSPDGVLFFVSDRSNWWNIYRYADGNVVCVVEKDAEFGLPQWVFGMSAYAFAGPSEIVCAYTVNGAWHLGRIDVNADSLQRIDTPYTQISGLRACVGGVVFTAGSPTHAWSVARLHPGSGEIEILRRSSDVIVDEEYMSLPEAVEFPTEGGLTAHGFFYAPRNRDYDAAPSDRPPLVVFVHGGPTGATSTKMNLSIQYWTSRGFAVFDVNYGGSTGYGRAYRQRLRGNWGVVDVDDCANGALYLVERGDARADQLAIRGGSAGGYTTLAVLTFRDAFAVGASYFGVSDIELLAKETHKFESRYMDSMVGPYPEAKDVYVERSPLHFTERLSCPVIFFQGLDDKIVLPNQAELMVEALRRKGVPVAYVPFEGEGHGFRQASNIKRTLEAELYFYARIFGVELADRVESVPIDNLE
ncbi:MAG: S9 family peptidase [Bacilli bacterium]